MMPTNLIASFNALLVGGGARKERSCNATNHNRRDGNELIEEWPCRSISTKKGSSKKPPSSNDVKVNYSVPLRQDGSGDLPRRSSGSRQQHRSNAKRLALDDHDESSCGTSVDSTLFNSVNSGGVSCYSLNDMPSIEGSARSITSRKSINTAPGLFPITRRRGINHDRPTRASRPRSGIASTSSKASVKKSVRFSEEAPSLHCYVPIATNTHYSARDDDYFRNYTITLARGVLRLLQTEAVRDESFDALTGLPSAQCLRRYLSHPSIPAEEVVGIEDLLAGTGVAAARKRLKKVQAKQVLAEQRRQRQLGSNDPKALARSLRKTSTISSNIARCRAAYALAMEDRVPSW